ncbi:MAG TPA: helix-turn-helix transcriptional regulator [Thermoanaerobaculia bacterium]|jgi:transcriptional regulator with XRE-family HTH domain|nr:helix-turn-helix transcriptional regulator [Thermoanaerobaculia bacterium]
MPVTREGELFGKTLRRLREERKLSQEKLANHPRLGSDTMSTNHVSDIERGLKVPSLTVVLKLAVALDCPPAELLADFTPATMKKLFR